MSKHVSTAQALPSELLRLVIEYAVSEPYYKSRADSTNINRIREFLSVCSAWRLAGLEYLWKDLHLKVREDENDVYDDRPTWVDNYWSLQSEHLVKELSITVSWNGIFNGAAFDLLYQYMAGTQCLPNVHKLRVLLTDKTVKLDCVYDRSIVNGL
ncbi:hypothetical protein GGH91_002732, partial [Coemansia sp. RSA 2671]